MNHKLRHSVEQLTILVCLLIAVTAMVLFILQIFKPLIAKAEDPKPLQHFELLHTTKLDKELTIKEVLDRDTVQHYLVFENNGDNFVIYKQPPLLRPLGDCIDGTTGNLCAAPLIKNPYGMNSFFIGVPEVKKAEEAPIKGKE